MNTRNHSPWIQALDKNIEYPLAEGHAQYDIGIIGAGIAGVSTAYHLLTQTDISVCLIEAKKIAHGATGHNAGQVVLYFEKPFQEIVAEYGIEKAIDGQQALFQGWEILEEIISKIHMEKEFEICEGFMGVRSQEQLKKHLENKYLRDTGGAQFDGIFIDAASDIKDSIPPHFLELCTLVEKDFIMKKLRTNEYFPVMMTSKKACINSALFCEKCIQYLLQHYGHRFHIYEHSPVKEIRLIPEKVNEIRGENYTIACDDIILCTNGFENFNIIDLYQQNSLATDRTFHKNVSGLVGYMAGFKTQRERASAISYFPDIESTDWKSEKYFYVTCRTFDDAKSLICTGGPDSLVPHDGHYDANQHDPQGSYEEIHSFLKQYRQEIVPDEFEYAWHGLMGYTKTGLRYIGQDLRNPHLWYNLGCNGVGITSSIYGGWKIAKTFTGKKFTASIFDPQ